MKKLLMIIFCMFYSSIVADTIHVNIYHSAFWQEKGIISDVQYLGSKENVALFKYEDSTKIYSIDIDYVEKLFIENETSKYR